MKVVYGILIDVFGFIGNH